MVTTTEDEEKGYTTAKSDSNKSDSAQEEEEEPSPPILMNKNHSSMFSLADYEMDDEYAYPHNTDSQADDDSVTSEEFQMSEYSDDLVDMGLAAAQDGVKTVITQSFRAFAFVVDSAASIFLRAHSYNTREIQSAGLHSGERGMGQHTDTLANLSPSAIDMEEDRLAELHSHPPRAFHSIISTLDDSTLSVPELDKKRVHQPSSGSEMDNDAPTDDDNYTEVDNPPSRTDGSDDDSVVQVTMRGISRIFPLRLILDASGEASPYAGYYITPPITPFDGTRPGPFRSLRSSFRKVSIGSFNSLKDAIGSWRKSQKIINSTEPVPSYHMQESGLFEDIEMFLLERVDITFLAARSLAQKIKKGEKLNKRRRNITQELVHKRRVSTDNVEGEGNTRRFYRRLMRSTKQKLSGIVTTPLAYLSSLKQSFSNLDLLGRGDRRFVHLENVDELKGVGELVRKQGYPYQEISVVTDDGYILRLERIPNPGSNKVLFLQHGVMDSSFTWVANGAEASLAFRAHDEGYDVFLGNFRGAGGGAARRHINENISEVDYWNFSINDHAFKDIPSFISCIVKTKLSEPKVVSRPHIMGVAHSMGGAVMIMYTIHQKQTKQPHNLDGLVLVSPAGIHLHSPLYARYGGRLIDLTVAKMVNSLRLPNDILTRAATKFVHDIKTMVPAVEDIISLGLAYALGGDDQQPRRGPFSAVNQLTYNALTCGTSTKTFVHLRQLIETGKFQAFDFEPTAKPNHFSSKKGGNMEAYGQSTPPEFTSLYHLIDIPVHLIAGLDDNLIGPQNVLRHYEFMKAAGVSVTIESFERCGHADFTCGMHSPALRGILSAIDVQMNRILETEKTMSQLKKKNLITAH